MIKISDIPKSWLKLKNTSLKAATVRDVHKYIRERDKGNPCISCGEYRTLEAGHFYAAGSYEILRFNFLNIHGQCKQCNNHVHGNLLEYRKRLIIKIGIEEVEKLEFLSELDKKTLTKRDNYSLSIIRLEAKQLFKELNKSFRL